MLPFAAKRNERINEKDSPDFELDECVCVFLLCVRAAYAYYAHINICRVDMEMLGFIDFTTHPRPNRPEHTHSFMAIAFIFFERTTL